jgi:hypothetical protein
MQAAEVPGHRRAQVELVQQAERHEPGAALEDGRPRLVIESVPGAASRERAGRLPDVVVRAVLPYR